MSNYQKLLNYYKECFDLVDCFHFNSETAGNVFKRYLPTCKGKVVSITHNGIKDHLPVFYTPVPLHNSLLSVVGLLPNQVC